MPTDALVLNGTTPSTNTVLIKKLNFFTHWGPNCHHFADDIFKSISVYENVWISLEISLKFIWLERKIFQHWFRLWSGAEQATNHYLNQLWLIQGRIYVSLGLHQFKYNCWRLRIHFHWADNSFFQNDWPDPVKNLTANDKISASRPWK